MEHDTAYPEVGSVWERTVAYETGDGQKFPLPESRYERFRVEVVVPGDRLGREIRGILEIEGKVSATYSTTQENFWSQWQPVLKS
jgi:alpha-tubulin suppressor-like RCC1 family protein